jgi:small GTP-binding protein
MNSKKIILTGTFGVGKTSLFKRLMYDVFEDKYITTIGLQTGKKEHDYQNYIIFDLAGEIAQEKVPSTHFLNAFCICYVVDLSRPNTFGSIADDLDFLKKQSTTSSLCVIGNKVDLLDNDQLLQTRLSSIPIECQILTSAKNGAGIEALAKMLTK